MLYWRSWDFWERVKVFAERKMRKAWLKSGNCDSCCRRCNQWESRGNRIKKVMHTNGYEHRTCAMCGYEWVLFITAAEKKKRAEGENHA